MLFVLLIAGNPTNCPFSVEHIERMHVTTGRDKTLPCKDFTDSGGVTLLEWIKGGEELIFSWKERLPDLSKNYKDKVSSPPSKEDDWALGLRGVEVSDQGEYCCCYMLGEADRKCSSVNLGKYFTQQSNQLLFFSHESWLDVSERTTSLSYSSLLLSLHSLVRYL